MERNTLVTGLGDGESACRRGNEEAEPLTCDNARNGAVTCPFDHSLLLVGSHTFSVSCVTGVSRLPRLGALSRRLLYADLSRMQDQAGAD
jgi:hypothetical protein